MPTSRDIEDIATPVSLSEAAAIAGFVPALPESGAPRSVYLVPAFALPAVVLSYERYDLWQVQLDDELVGKWLGGGTSLEDLTVSGRPARWISGGTHVVRFIGSDGTEMAGTRRIVERNTLIWRTPFAFYRIETDLPVGDALTIAESLP